MAHLFERSPVESCGLVMLFPDENASIWDTEMNSIVNAVEDSVEGAFVTFALANGRHPSLLDGLSAVRFNGCTSAVVVVVGAYPSGRTLSAVFPVKSEFPVTLTQCRRDARSVADAFLDVVLAQPAACA